MQIVIDKLFAGEPAPLGPRGAPSAICKRPIEGPWIVTADGLVGDAQGDRVNHGGLEKALHHYPQDHYASWARELPILAETLAEVPAFGENISTIGLTEADVCIGDIFRVGGVTLQIAQGRQPCWKLNARFGIEDMAVRVQRTGRTGWYYRVVEPGRIVPGDGLKQLDRLHPEWPLSRITALLYERTLAFDELAALAQLPELADGWRRLAERRIKSRSVESWQSRLEGSES